VKGKEERKRDKKEKKKREREGKGTGKLLSEGECRRRINRFNAILLFPHLW